MGYFGRITLEAGTGERIILESGTRVDSTLELGLGGMFWNEVALKLQELLCLQSL